MATIYLAMGALFFAAAIIHEANTGNRFLSYVFLFIATLDFGMGFRLIFAHFRNKNKE